MLKISRLTKVFWIVLSLGMIGVIAFAQIPGIPRGVPNIFGKEEPIATSLADAVTEVEFLDNFNPENTAPLSILPRGSNNEFRVNKPGRYVFLSQSYCLRAGAFGPGSGDGYLYAPLRGPGSTIIQSVLRNSVDHPEIPQRDIQVLLWAILSRTKPSKMNAELAQTARVLLTSEEILRLEGLAFEEVSRDLFRRALGKLPARTRRILEAESRLRNAFTTGSLPYEDVERIAVLSGDPLASKNDRPVPLGRWSYLPEGYFIRYFPSGYSTTRIEVYFPEQFVVEKDPEGRIKSVSNQDGERLEFEYDDAIRPLTIKNESSLRGYAFKAVKLNYAFPKDEQVETDLGMINVAVWRDSGWLLSGRIKGKGKVLQTEQKFAGAEQRYKTAKRQKSGLENFSGRLKKLRKEKKVKKISKEEFENLLRLMQLKISLTEMFMGAASGQEFFDPIQFVQRAWASELVRNLRMPGSPVAKRMNYSVFESGFTSLLDPYPATTGTLFEQGLGFDGGGAFPGKTGRQRLGQSNRPQEPDNRCADGYKKCMDETKTEFLRCFSKCMPIEWPADPTRQQMNQLRECSLECRKRFRKEKKDCATLAQDCLEN